MFILQTQMTLCTHLSTIIPQFLQSIDIHILHSLHATGFVTDSATGLSKLQFNNFQKYTSGDRPNPKYPNLK